MVTIIRRLVLVIKALGLGLMEQQLVVELESQAREFRGLLLVSFRVNLMRWVVYSLITLAVILILVLVVMGILLRFCKMDFLEVVNWREEEMKMEIEGKEIMG